MTNQPISRNWVGPEVVICKSKTIPPYPEFVFGPFVNHMVIDGWLPDHKKECDREHTMRHLNSPKED